MYVCDSLVYHRHLTKSQLNATKGTTLCFPSTCIGLLFGCQWQALHARIKHGANEG